MPGRSPESCFCCSTQQCSVVGYNILDLGDLCWVYVEAEACCDVMRLDPGAEKVPDEKSVVEDKHNTLLRNGKQRIIVTLGKH